MRLPGQKTAASISAIRASNGAVARFFIVASDRLVTSLRGSVQRRGGAQADCRAAGLIAELRNQVQALEARIVKLDEAAEQSTAAGTA